MYLFFGYWNELRDALNALIYRKTPSETIVKQLLISRRAPKQMQENEGKKYPEKKEEKPDLQHKTLAFKSVSGYRGLYATE